MCGIGGIFQVNRSNNRELSKLIGAIKHRGPDNTGTWFDKNIIDGIIKQIESNSVLGSVQIRKVTTGSARDYILMATVGALCIFALLVGVNN